MTDGSKKRGRPREFEPAVALAGAAETFLRYGYAGTSVDALASAMRLNKPSLYAAFGDKHALFITVLNRRFQHVAARYEAAFHKGKTLEEALRNLFEDAVDLSLGEGGPPGCPILAASTIESLIDEEIGEFTRRFRAQTDKGMAIWIRNKLPQDSDTSAETIARLTNGILHDIALRARVGEPRAKLKEIAKDAAKVLARAALPTWRGRSGD
jgi:TetR/AcrR family transcriptional regulator, copper-responsive repressor